MMVYQTEHYGPCAEGGQRDEDDKRKFVQINNYIKSLSFLMNGVNLIQLEKKKCGALCSKQLPI